MQQFSLDVISYPGPGKELFRRQSRGVISSGPSRCKMHKAGEISKLRLLLHSISEELITDELESLKYLCGDHLTRAKLEKIDNAKQLFVSITEVIEGVEEQLKFLIQLFESIGRRDLKAKIEEFQNLRQGRLLWEIILYTRSYPLTFL